MAGLVVLAVLAILVSTAIIWAGSEWLEEASARLAIHYDLPPVVQGGLIAAAGSSFPEFASVVIAALAGSFDLGVGAIVGSAVFNVLVIPALAVVLSPGGIDATRTLVHKETLFYMMAIVVLFLTFALALIYNPGDVSLTGELTRPLMLLPIGVYALYLFLQWQDTVDYGGRKTVSTVNVRKQWALLVLGLAVIIGGVWILVESVLYLGTAFDVPNFLWGVTIVAAATSLPDALVSIRAADKNRDVASIANVLGSNIFDLLVVLPVGVVIIGSETVDFAVTAPMMGVLVAATVLLFVTLRTGLTLSQHEAYILLASYGMFLAWIAAEGAGLVSVLP